MCETACAHVYRALHTCTRVCVGMGHGLGSICMCIHIACALHIHVGHGSGAHTWAQAWDSFHVHMHTRGTARGVCVWTHTHGVLVLREQYMRVFCTHRQHGLRRHGRVGTWPRGVCLHARVWIHLGLCQVLRTRMCFYPRRTWLCVHVQALVPRKGVSVQPWGYYGMAGGGGGGKEVGLTPSSHHRWCWRCPTTRRSPGTATTR